jgi:hypothetical protein
MVHVLESIKSGAGSSQQKRKDFTGQPAPRIIIIIIIIIFSFFFKKRKMIKKALFLISSSYLIIAFVLFKIQKKN